jgi:sugar/nucleoside kinase (ribokinase family)
LPNSDEAMALSGLSEVERAASALAVDFPVVAVTCGAAGALWADQGQVIRRPTMAGLGSIVDTTGAGDAFTAGLLAGWLAGQPPNSCLDTGQRAAAKVVARWGAQ